MDKRKHNAIAVALGLLVATILGVPLFGIDLSLANLTSAPVTTDGPIATSTPITTATSSTSVTPPAPNPLVAKVNFSANPRVISRGDSTELIWSSDANSCDTSKIPGGSINGPREGSLTVSPKRSFLYVIRCYKGEAYTEVIIGVIVND